MFQKARRASAAEVPCGGGTQILTEAQLKGCALEGLDGDTLRMKGPEEAFPARGHTVGGRRPGIRRESSAVPSPPLRESGGQR